MIKYFLYSIILFQGFISPLKAQSYKFSQVQKLSTDVNTDTEELMPLYSPTEKKLYFSRALYDKNTGGKYAGMDIWVSERQGYGWEKATNDVHEWNNKENNAVIGLSNDGKIVYLIQAYSKTNGIAFSKLIGGKWTEPEVIPLKGLPKDGFKGFYMNQSYDVLLISMQGKNAYGKEDLYVSLKSVDGWSLPQNLGRTINTESYEISPFLSPDGRKLFFSSAGHGGYGDADIFMSERLYNNWDVWTKPVNLGKNINTPGFDAYFSIYGDSLAFYCSNVKSDYGNIYSAKAVLQTYKPLDNLNSIYGTVNDTLPKSYLTEQETTEALGLLVDMRLKFNRDSYDLGFSAREKLSYIVNRLKRYPQIKIQIEGYGDFRTSNDVNEKLGKRRVEETIKQLQADGYSGEHIFISGIHVADVDKDHASNVYLRLYRTKEQ